MGVDRLVRAKISKVQRAPAASGARLRAAATLQVWALSRGLAMAPSNDFDEKDLAGDSGPGAAGREITVIHSVDSWLAAQHCND